ncbi:MAG: hypothetical protein JO083_08040 [Candidatus Eremiobacteraeota bacterium]|nr:hypothetical protein [Candidatus Eremiobacteraeota bacterium]MBV8371504.1 hypothetical protein [Candidatus Eremiobacteraeota bacterium]
MIDDRLRRDELRLRRAQEIADGLRRRRAEMLEELQLSALRSRGGPIPLDAYRASRTIAGIPDDAG